MVQVISQLRSHDLNADRFADLFRSSLPLPPAIESNLRGALSHVLENPGSLIRPRLIFEIATAYGIDPRSAEHLAIALEYFHSASLLFDDLPCMDNALERRGAPCTHLLFGEAEAILGALALINRAYALTWRAVAGCSPAVQARALDYVELCLGIEGLLNGQSLDLHYRSLPHTRESTERIARGKTVALIRLTLVLPAMLGGASDRELRLLERIALFWGLSYQVLDDMKDLLQRPEEARKTVAHDIQLGRPNTAAVIGINAAFERIGKLIATGNSALRRLVCLRDGLSFLYSLPSKLEEELSLLNLEARISPAGGRP
jgi:geranylgeranyl diphosphate synthase, type II